MPINVGDLLKERDRLAAVIEEAKIARSRIRQINVLIAMYGDQKNVTVRTAVGPLASELTCDQCGSGPFANKAGVGTHKSRMHGKMTKAQRSAAAKKAQQARDAKRPKLRRVS